MQEVPDLYTPSTLHATQLEFGEYRYNPVKHAVQLVAKVPVHLLHPGSQSTQEEVPTLPNLSESHSRQLLFTAYKYLPE